MKAPELTGTGLKILVVQHSDRAPGGVFSAALQQQGAELVLVRPFDGAVLPENAAGYDGLVVLGGPQHAGDDQQGQHFPQLMTLMRRFDADTKPVAGICLGCQLLARAHGGQVRRLGRLEFGFVELGITGQGKADMVLGTGQPPAMMEFHEDTFDLPEHAVLLVEGSACRNQCFRIGKVSYGFQFHLEVDEPVVRDWLRMFTSGDLGSYSRHHGQFDGRFLAELSDNIPELIRHSVDYGRSVAIRWLALVRRCSTAGVLPAGDQAG